MTNKFHIFTKVTNCFTQIHKINKSVISSLYQFTDDIRLQVHKKRPGDVFSTSSVTEEDDQILMSFNDFVIGHLSIRLHPMFQAAEFLAACQTCSMCTEDKTKELIYTSN